MGSLLKAFIVGKVCKAKTEMRIIFACAGSSGINKFLSNKILMKELISFLLIY